MTVRGLVDADREVALLLDIVAATQSGPGVEPVAAAVARLITAATPADVCFVHVLDDSGGSLTLAGATPPFDEHIGQVQLQLGEGVSGWVARHREPVVITSDKDDDPRYVPIAALRGSDFTSMASVPMETGPGRLVGVLNVHTVQRREFTDRDIQLLLAIGRLTAGALDQARVHRQLAMRERVHGDFAEQVIAAQESERRRLAGDIHDGISQRLVSLSYRLDAAARAVEIDDAAEATEQLEKARDLVDLTLAEARSAISGLRPPVLDDLGLAGGLASLAATIPEVDLDLELADDRLSEHVEVALYRIAQECLQNVVKHSRALTAKLRFAVGGGQVLLEVSDDGIGFDGSSADRAPTSYGMLSMTERAELVGGRLVVRSAPGAGTTVTVTVPLTAGVGQAG
ncbi:GAF domain-containing sensor histidine kinase [Mycobacterium bourgelatii]|uniref:Oxygen sensor histidine kinase NreB n=1 Tax=Mycobacterium bourgelatii TaxID=1273442 RepID=A0A7I9YR94_MYCBU|nr:GAF domain-containing sensor histidine kinase [Mycobacterium bourgelatii]MCV6974360.1 GAF domain-containing sensor histidine kinase [Mycobacterium bourgelatii]GFG91178.1 sensor histidine kinase [Mycobacterium bourgelatii]